MPRKTLEERQDEIETRRCAEKLMGAFRVFWPNIDDLTILVTGQHEPPDATRIELSLTIHVHSTSALAGALHGNLVNNANQLTFVQVGNAVPTGSCITFLCAQYTGSDPPTIPP